MPRRSSSSCLLIGTVSDHFKPSTIKRLHDERPSLRFGCCEWLLMPLLEAGVDKRVIDVYEPDNLFRYDGFCEIVPVRLIHNVPNCGYRIFANGEKLFFATDTGTLEGITAKDYDLYLVEANHSQAEIEARYAEKREAGEFVYEYKAAANHLSREQAEDWLYRQMKPTSRYVFLHQHKEVKRIDG